MRVLRHVEWTAVVLGLAAMVAVFFVAPHIVPPHWGRAVVFPMSVSMSVVAGGVVAYGSSERHRVLNALLAPVIVIVGGLVLLLVFAIVTMLLFELHGM